MTMPTKRAILFDFDGTIVDSEPLFLEIVNELADEFGFEKLLSEEFTALRRLSFKEFVTQRLQIPLWRIRKLRRLERRSMLAFKARSGELHAFPGMAEGIARLRLQGYFVGVVTLSPQSVVEEVLARHQITVDAIVAGSNALLWRKTRSLKKMLKEQGLDAKRTLYVGDELRDVEACRRMHVDMVGVGWGLNSAEALREASTAVASTPEELFAMLAARL